LLGWRRGSSRRFGPTALKKAVVSLPKLLSALSFGPALLSCLRHSHTAATTRKCGSGTLTLHWNGYWWHSQPPDFYSSGGRIHLGRLWSDWLTKKAGHHVVDTGPYRLVRHPMYLGLIFAAFATAIEKGTSYALFGAAILTFGFYTKARREERFLRVELGEDAYDEYARKTAMLVPFTGRPPN
jgi:hypothetical protein